MLISLTTSGITVLPFTYDASVAIPTINKVVSAGGPEFRRLLPAA